MAWYDHEELKPLEDRSDRYKLEFPSIYGMTRQEMEEHLKKEAVVPIKKVGDTGNQKWVIDKSKTYEEGDQIQASDAVNDRPVEYIKRYLHDKVLASEKNSVSLKFNEDQYLKEVLDYISSTYNQHYAKDQEVQSIEMIISAGHGEGFALGNISKLAARYGKKLGHNRQDLLKILHYGVLALHIHDKFYKEND